MDILLKRGSTLFLRGAVIVIGLLVLALCIFVVPSISRDLAVELPQAAYMHYPFLIALYGSASVFYIAIYQAFKLLRSIDKNTAFSDSSVHALKQIKYCAISIAFFFATTLPLFYHFAEADDAPGVIVVGMAIVGVPLVIAVFAAILQMLLKNAIDIKKENEFTV